MRVRIVVVLISLLSLGAAAFAQTETGRITGTVTDPQDRVVPGVTVTATSTTTGGLRTTVTDANGQFVIANVQPAPYDLKFTLSGFKTATMHVVVAVGQAVSAEAKLEVGGTTETVTVVATPENVNIVNAEVSTVVREEQLRELGSLTRDPYDLVNLSGNVQAQPEDQILNGGMHGVGVNINGGRSSGTNILLDGSANNDEFSASVGQSVPLDSVQEFSVVTNNFSAQYGRSSGGVVNVVTKSGTNAFHGTAYEFFRSEKLSTNTPENIANGVEKGKFKRNQPGYSLGGPILKDKAHFFTSYELTRVRSFDTLYSWVPTPQLLAASAPATRAYFATYDKGALITGPTLSRGEVSANIGSGSGAFSSLPAGLPVFGRVDKSLPIDAGGGDPQDQHQFVGRVDWNMGPGTQVYIRYALQNQTAQPGTNSASPYPGFDTGFVNKNHSVLGSVTHVYSNSLTSQTKFVFNRLLSDQPINGASTPRLVMNPTIPVFLAGYRIAFPGYLPWNPGNDIPFGGPQRLFQFYHDQTWLKGSHDIRFGGSYVHIEDDRTFSAYSNSVEALSISSNTLSSLDNLVSGTISRFQSAINPNGLPGGTFVTPVDKPSFTSHNRYNEFAIYAEDNVSVGARLRLNLGLRYEYFGPQQKSDPKYDTNFYYGDPNLNIESATPTQIIDAVRSGKVLESRNSPTGTLWRPDKNNVAPRIGFAWDVTGDGRTSVRGGYGISYERNFGNVTFNVLFNPPLYLVATIDSPADVATQAIYTDNLGPFGGIAGVTKPIPAGSLRHVDQNIRTAFMHQYGASIQHELRPGLVASVEYNGSSGRDLYDLADINKRGAPLYYGDCSGTCTAQTRPNPSYGAFNTRGNRGRSQFHGVTLGIDGRAIARTGLSFTTKYTLSQAKDNLSTTFSESPNNNNLGYMDAFNPMLDYGNAEYDVRHRFLFSALWSLPFLNEGNGLKETLLGGWGINGTLVARTGYPFSVYDCTNQNIVCMRAEDPKGMTKLANGTTPTGNPNEFKLLDLTPLLATAGAYVNPITGNTDFGPYPSDMTERGAFRGPGNWNVDLALVKRFRFGGGRSATFRAEMYNVFDHANMLVHTENNDISSTSFITGYKTGNRRAQLGFKFEF